MKIIRLRGILDSNTYVIPNGNEAICIDAGVSYKDCKETLGNSVRIVAVLLTHGHFDHCFYAKNFQENGAKIYIHQSDSEMLNSASKNLSAHFDYESEFSPLNADYYVQDGENLNIAGLKIQVLHIPGHSGGSVAYIIDNAMFCGDTLFFNSYGRTDLGSNTSYTMLKQSIIEKIFTLDVNYTIYSGHGQSTMLKYEKENNPINNE